MMNLQDKFIQSVLTAQCNVIERNVQYVLYIPNYVLYTHYTTLFFSFEDIEQWRVGQTQMSIRIIYVSPSIKIYTYSVLVTFYIYKCEQEEITTTEESSFFLFL
jgi:hypothetical protein